MPHWKAIGPISLQGGPGASKNQVTTDLPSKRLRVVSPPTGTAPGAPAAVAPEDLLELCGGDPTAVPWGLRMAGGSDCVLAVRSDPTVAVGTIVLDEVAEHNVFVKAGDTHQFMCFEPPDDEAFDLVELDAEVRLLRGGAHEHSHPTASAPGAAVEVDAERLTSLLALQYFGRVLANNEVLVLLVDGAEVVVRVTATQTLTPEERDEAIGYHCFRGALTATTAIFLRSHDQPCESSGHSGMDTTPSSSAAAQEAEVAATAQRLQHVLHLSSSASPLEATSSHPDAPPDLAEHAAATHTSCSGTAFGSANCATAADAAADGAHGKQTERAAHSAVHASSSGTEATPSASSAAHLLPKLQLVNARTRAGRPAPTATVNVYTNDGEWFPVKKKLLRPCISLTKLVRDGGADCPSVNLDIDTATFDRVLLFLEAELLARPPPQWSLHLVEPMAGAAELLGARGLEDYCQGRLGKHAAGLRLYSFDEVKAANASGQVWLILDGMVLDVTRWLPEHPGGASIIPKQSLNMDCARFFEIYHSSRESFLYLKDFYIGELRPEERAAVPLCTVQPTGRQPKHMEEGAAAEELGAEFILQLRQYTTFRMALAAPAEEDQIKIFKSF